MRILGRLPKATITDAHAVEQETHCHQRSSDLLTSDVIKLIVEHGSALWTWIYCSLYHYLILIYMKSLFVVARQR